MRQDPRLATATEQRLALLPRMLQSIEILQMAGVELLAHLEAELSTNEVLEDRSSRLTEELPQLEAAERELSELHREDVELGQPEEAWSDSPEASDGSTPDMAGGGDTGETTAETFEARESSRGAAASDAAWAALQNTAGPNLESVEDLVLAQLAWCDAPATVRIAVQELLPHLDARGYLTLRDDELNDLLGGTLACAALDLLRTFEPHGLGARSPAQAIWQSLPVGDPDVPLARVLLEEHLESLSRGHLPHVARSCGVSVEEVLRLLDRLRDVAPAILDKSGRAESPVRPDVVVETKADGSLRVIVDDATLPDLGLDPSALALVASSDTGRPTKTYLRSKIRAARDLIDAVEQRRFTLARVVQVVMEHQRDFLVRGAEALRPLRMVDVAATLELAASTVSRAVADKWVQTDRGVVPLRGFFDGGSTMRRSVQNSGATGVATCGADENIGRGAVLQRLLQLVDEEDAVRPHSDDALVDQLASRFGLRVARRTVAKYREELQIPSSIVRRQRGRTEAGDHKPNNESKPQR